MDRRQDRLPHRPDQVEPVVPTVEGAQADPKQLRRLGFAAAAEASTLLLLVGVAVPLKHLGDWPLAVRVLGPVHGFAFVAYLWLVLRSLGAGLLSRGEAVRLCLSAFVPMAGYVVARFIAGRASNQADRGTGR